MIIIKFSVPLPISRYGWGNSRWGPAPHDEEIRIRCGRPDFQPVRIPYPLGGLDTEQIMERAANLRDQIVAVLTAPD